ncbi:MAG: hypothetical protein LAO77_22245 [Acidobacteriia bacterium]|nr:hypothetical protein [Terriglobia bacterium]
MSGSQFLCGKCGSGDTRVNGLSTTPPCVCVKCLTCGHMTIIDQPEKALPRPPRNLPPRKSVS